MNYVFQFINDVKLQNDIFESITDEMKYMYFSLIWTALMFNFMIDFK